MAKLKRFKCKGCGGCCVSLFPEYIFSRGHPGFKVISGANEAEFKKNNKVSSIAYGFILAKEDIENINTLGLTPHLNVARTLKNVTTGKTEASITITRTPLRRDGSWVWGCCFLNDKLKCDIYPQRPLVCRAYPFLRKDLDSGANICHDKTQGRVGEYKTTLAEARVRDKYLKSRIYFESPLSQDEMIPLAKQDRRKLDSTIISHILKTKKQKTSKECDRIGERNRVRWGEFKNYIISQTKKPEH
ncbi:MAG: YkgJ family cysteine cluster protein [Candidatus Altiarchaeota archaeon]